ncbi:MAG: V-type ATPase 116kDa subunit family protein [Bacteroidota bacterium]
MKAAFKKLDLLAHRDERETIISVLQELGVIHLELDHTFRNDRIDDLELQKSRLTKTIAFVQEQEGTSTDTPSSATSENLTVDEVVNRVTELRLKQEKDAQQAELLRKQRQKLTPWGNFDPNRLTQLAQAGIQVSFYIAPQKDFKKFDFDQLTYQVIHQSLDQVYLVVFSTGRTPELPFSKVELPAGRIPEIQAKEQALTRQRADAAKSARSYLAYLPTLNTALVKLENEWMLNLANGSYQEYAEGSILHLTGWFPANMEGRLLHYLKSEKLSYSISEPVAGDTVPVLLKNPKYPKLFEAITKIFQLPSYYEMDLTPFIAVFYPILFAYCLGDAGYGLILLFAATLGWFTFLKDARSMAILGIVLGIFTTIMGVVKSGSIFGLPIVDNSSHPIFIYLSQYVVIPDDQGVVFNAFNVALLIGVVQILTGILVSIYNKIHYQNLVAGLPQIGKLLIVVGLIWVFLADSQGVVVLQPGALVRKLLLVVGVLLVLGFHDMKQSPLVRVASGILPLFFILTGILGDVLSYVRLFALGVASSVLGLVVNQIAVSIMGDRWWGIPLGIVFLLFGHGLNLALATLGAFVHPLRLTFVEFYNNANFEGGGVAYKPLRKV